jgi:hypothetical protein
MKIPTTLALYTILFNMFFIAFGFKPEHKHTVYIVASFEIIFATEIILNFLTTYKDPENFETVTKIKMIAQHYVLHGHFILHVLTVIPYTVIYPPKFNDDY